MKEDKTIFELFKERYGLKMNEDHFNNCFRYSAEKYPLNLAGAYGVSMYYQLALKDFAEWMTDEYEQVINKLDTDAVKALKAELEEVKKDLKVESDRIEEYKEYYKNYYKQDLESTKVLLKSKNEEIEGLKTTNKELEREIKRLNEGYIQSNLEYDALLNKLEGIVKTELKELKL